MHRNVLSAAFLSVTMLFAASGALADTKDDVNRLRTTRKAERYNVNSPGTSIRTGGAQILINAPVSVVRTIVTDFANYQSFMPRFRKSRVVAKTRQYTDVYLEVPILHDAATVWTVARFAPPSKQADGTEIVAGTFQQGNVKDFRASWRLIPVEGNKTLLKSEILIVPSLPLPSSIVTPELEYASDKAVTSVRDRAEAAALRVAQGAPTTP